jgi:fluoride exporter
MSLSIMIGLGMLGGVGAVARFLLDGGIAGRLGREFPYGTLAVNLCGSFLLGAFAGAALDDDTHRLVGIGLVGGFTTFSTWTLESHRLGEDGELRIGLLNFAVSLVLGVAVAWAGRHLGAAL